MDETISQCQFGRKFLIKESAAEALLSGHPPRDAKKRYPLLELASFFCYRLATVLTML